MLVATAVAVVVGLVPTPATAAPAPDPTQQLNDLNQQASLLNDQVLQAKDALAAKQAELSKANADVITARNAAADARDQQAGYRQQVDQLVSASFQGAQFSQLSALLTSSSPKQFLNQSTMLDILSQENQAGLNQLSALVAQTDAADKAAQDAQQRAQQAADAAAKINSDLQQKQSALTGQMQQVKAQIAQLSAAAQAAYSSRGYLGSIVAPPGIAGAAMATALAERGVWYEWGGASPSGFDCSGLVQWSYAQHGVSLPRTAQGQFGVGQAVSRSNLQPGDLVFFGYGPSSVDHVGIYVGNNQMVNAATSGTVVRVQALWPYEYQGARRIGA